MLILFTNDHWALLCHLPELFGGCQVQRILDANVDGGLEVDGYFQGGDTYTIEGRSRVLLVQRS